MTTDDSLHLNKQLLRCYVGELNRRNLDVLDALVADDVVVGPIFGNGDPDPPVIGRGPYRQEIEEHIAAVPDYHVTIHEMIAEGDQVVLCWSSRGTERQSSPDAPATEKIVTRGAVSIYHIVGGQIVEVRGL